MKLRTAELQEAVTQVYKGAGNNKIIPITSLINIMENGHQLFLTTTDAVNYFTVVLDVEDDKTRNASVNVNQFVKLIQKMSSPDINIDFLDNCLMLTGNGKYKLELVLDENGKSVVFPSYLDDMPEEVKTVKLTKIQQLVNNNKASIAVSNDVPCLQNYYCGEDAVTTTDTFKICQTSGKLLDKVCLISPVVMDLLSTFHDENINYRTGDKAYVFSTDKELLYTPFVDGADKVPIDTINALVQHEISSMCKVLKPVLLDALDRLSVVVDDYDKNIIKLSFSDNKIRISSKKSTGEEVIEYVESSNPIKFDCLVDLEMLRSQISTIKDDRIVLYYGSDTAIKFVTGDVVRVVALAGVEE